MVRIAVESTPTNSLNQENQFTMIALETVILAILVPRLPILYTSMRPSHSLQSQCYLFEGLEQLPEIPDLASEL